MAKYGGNPSTIISQHCYFKVGSGEVCVWGEWEGGKASKGIYPSLPLVKKKKLCCVATYSWWLSLVTLWVRRQWAHDSPDGAPAQYSTTRNSLRYCTCINSYIPPTNHSTDISVCHAFLFRRSSMCICTLFIFTCTYYQLQKHTVSFWVQNLLCWMLRLGISISQFCCLFNL